MRDVLIVDDDFMVAEIHRRFVERIEGFQPVAVARSGAEALAAAAEADKPPISEKIAALKRRQLVAQRRGLPDGVEAAYAVSDGNYQDTCPHCRRSQVTLAQSARVGGFG